VERVGEVRAEWIIKGRRGLIVGFECDGHE
jgi:hypothetical protein